MEQQNFYGRYTAQEVNDVSIACMCLLANIASPQAAQMAQFILGEGIKNHTWAKDVKELREMIVDEQATILKEGDSTPEWEEHFARHMGRIAEVMDR